MQKTKSQYHLPEIGKKLAYKTKRAGVADHFPDPSVRKTIEGDLARLDPYAQSLRAMALYLTRSAKVHDGHTYARLQSVPGIGQLLALVL